MAKTSEQLPHGRSYHHGDLRSALIAAARGMLERDGPEAISFRAIARAVGVSQTAPYNHFHGKEHLLATLATAGFRELEASQIAAAGGGGTAADQIDALGRAYVRFACAQPQLYRLMFGVGVLDWCAYPEIAEAKKASYRPVQEALAAHLTAAGKDGPDTVETAAVAAWALVHGLSMLLIDRAFDPGSEAGTLVGRVTAWFVAGLEAGATTCGGDAATAKGSR